MTSVTKESCLLVVLAATGAVAVGAQAPAGQGSAGTVEYRVLATARTSTMEEELNEAAEAGFDPALVYALGEPASPGVYIRQLAVTQNAVPNALLNALHDWTGQTFGEAPLPQVRAEWERWWSNNASNYTPGQRYFFGHLVP